MWVAVSIIALAAAAHQWWSCNLFTMVSDVFPKSAVASVIGIGGFAGAMSAMLMQRMTGRLLDASADNYGLIFGICGLRISLRCCSFTCSCRAFRHQRQTPDTSEAWPML